MKKISFLLVSGVFLGILFFPSVSVLAVMVGDDGGGGNNTGNIVAGTFEIPNPLKATSVEAVVKTVSNFIFWLAIILTPLLVLWAAFYFVTAGGDPARVKTGKDILLWTVIGFGVILFGRGLVYVLQSALGV